MAFFAGSRQLAERVPEDRLVAEVLVWRFDHFGGADPAGRAGGRVRRRRRDAAEAEARAARQSRRRRRRCACSTRATGTVHQIAVGVVDLEDLEAGFQRALGGVHPVALEGDEIGRRRAAAARYALGHRLRGRCDGVPGLLAARKVVRGQRARCRTRVAAWSPCGPHARSGCRAPLSAPS